MTVPLAVSASESGRCASAAPAPALDWRRALDARPSIDLGRLRLAERVLTRGEPLFSQGETGDHAFVALSGWVALEHMLPNGSCQVIDFALPGSLVGHQRSLDGAHTVGAHCVTDCWLAVFPRRKLLDLVRTHDDLYDLYEATLADDCARIQRHLANVTRRRGPEKLADFIVELVDRGASVRVDEDPLTLPISQTQCAAALGVTNVYISRIAKALSAQRFIDWRTRRLHVRDVDALRLLAASA